MPSPFDNESEPKKSSAWYGGRRWYLATGVLFSTFISYSPVIYGRNALVEGGVSKNDLWVFVAFPLLSAMLMVTCVIGVLRLPSISHTFAVRWIREKKRSDVLSAAVLSITVVAVLTLFACISMGLHIPPSRRTVFSTAWPGRGFWAGYALQLMVLTPFAEEVFWRGYVQGVLEKSFNSLMGLLLQAILFALVHLSGLVDTFSLLLLALILGLWRHRTKTLVPVIVAHAVWNAMWLILFSHGLPPKDESGQVRLKYNYGTLLEDLCRPADYEPGENAVPYYARAFSLVTDLPQRLTTITSEMWSDDLPEETIRDLRDWTSRNEAALAAFEAGTCRPYCIQEYGRMSFEQMVSLPFRAKSMEIVSVLLARAWVGVTTEADCEQSVSDIVICYRFGWHHMGPKPLTEQLLGLTIRERVLRAAFKILQRQPTNHSLLAGLRAWLDAVPRNELAPIDFSGERLVCHEIVQGLFADNESERDRIPPNVIRHLMTMPAYAKYGTRVWQSLDGKCTERLIDTVFAYLDSVKHREPAELYHAKKGVRTTLRQMVNDNALLLVRTEEYEGDYYRAYRCKARRDALRVVIAIMQYYLEQGQLPNELGQLVSERYLDALPSDPFSGLSFVYSRVGQDFLLYSLGPDFDDDHGAGGDVTAYLIDGDDVFWPVRN